MKPLFKCELDYLPSNHLSQIYTGFEQLKKAGVIDLSIRYTGEKTGATKPVLKVKINNKYKVIYDTLDGLNWIKGSIEDNLNYIKTHLDADFYFKRSYSKNILKYFPSHCKVYPLGLNYYVESEDFYFVGIKESIKHYIKEIYVITKILKINKNFYTNDFEFYPFVSKETKILFFTRLWTPDDIIGKHFKSQIESINENRVRYIKACKKEFGDCFTGGLENDTYSNLHAKGLNAEDLIVPYSLTNRKTFLNTIKNHNICITTTGLHNSIGWKFGEYVAASRAIVSEPLAYELPGDFKSPKNYLAFSNEEELISRINLLRENKDLLFEIMKNNFHYYNNYVRPDKLVLNTLLAIYMQCY
ncbi:hypothetical protein BCS42_05820 [Crenothrix sp. D3]|nr:hypothetical protein BCS42_05820 [Crenothrix sp. D3]